MDVDEDSYYSVCTERSVFAALVGVSCHVLVHEVGGKSILAGDPEALSELCVHRRW